MSIKKSFLFSSIGSYTEIVIGFASSIIIARLLTPGEIGIFSVAISIIGFAHLIRNFGIGEYIIQEKNITKEKLRSAFTINVTLGWILAIAIYLSRNIFAEFYHEPGIAEVFKIIAINFFLIPFGANSISLLRRSMRFDQLMVINILSSLISTTTGIVCALNGLSYLSLAWAAIAGTSTTIIGALAYSPRDFSIIPGFSHIKPIFSYGSFSCINQIFQHLGTTTPDIILGKISNMYAVGIFSRAMGSLNLIATALVNGIRPILMPYFAECSRNNSNLNKNYLILTSTAIAFIWPTISISILLAPEIIEFLYGDQWLEAASIFQIIALEGFLWPFTLFAEDLLKATGNVRKLAKSEVIITPIRFILVVIAAKQNLQLVAFTLFFSYIIKFLYLIILLKQLNIRITDQLKPIMVNALTLTPCSILAFLLKDYFIDSNLLIILKVSIIFFLTWLLTLIFIQHPTYKLIKVYLNKKK